MKRASERVDEPLRPAIVVTAALRDRRGPPRRAIADVPDRVANHCDRVMAPSTPRDPVDLASVHCETEAS